MLYLITSESSILSPRWFELRVSTGGGPIFIHALAVEAAIADGCYTAGPDRLTVSDSAIILVTADDLDPVQVMIRLQRPVWRIHDG